MASKLLWKSLSNKGLGYGRMIHTQLWLHHGRSLMNGLLYSINGYVTHTHIHIHTDLPVVSLKASDNGHLNDICTVYELHSGDMTTSEGL